MMSGIRSKNTKPEIMIRKSLHHIGFRYRLHDDSLPGKPDIVLRKFKVAIFVNGCFWHMHSCGNFKFPKTQDKFWKEKLTKNKLRDQKVIEQLHEAGWRVFVIWECAVRKIARDPDAPSNFANQVGEWIVHGKNSGEVDSDGNIKPLKILPIN